MRTRENHAVWLSAVNIYTFITDGGAILYTSINRLSGGGMREDRQPFAPVAADRLRIVRTVRGCDRIELIDKDSARIGGQRNCDDSKDVGAQVNEQAQSE